MEDDLVGYLIKKIDVLLSVESQRFKELQNIKKLLEEMTQLIFGTDQIGARILWEDEVVRIVHRLSDLIDEFGDLHYESEGSVSRLPKKLIRRLKNVVYGDYVSIRMKIIRFELEQLLGGMKSPLNEHTTEVWDDAIYIGMDMNITTLINWLANGECRAIAVQGMGGLGKTALTRQVYNHQEIRMKFEFRAWITVSPTHSTVEILQSIFSQFFPQETLIPTKIDLKDLIQMIHDHMQKERCIIIFDDVWSVDGWDDIHHIFPDSTCRSKMLYTTRDYNLALKLASQDFVLKLQPLKEEEAWALFCRRAFSKTGGSFPSELEEFARQLVKKCDGLPLAICVLARLMLMNKINARSDCRLVLDYFKSLVADDKSIKGSLKLSFDNMPYRLKNCFLYCSAFPEDFSISKMRLVRSWVAEGFVEAHEGLTIEEVAEGYFDELISRGLLQVAETDHTNGIIACKMNYFIRNLAVTISREEKFCVSYSSAYDQIYLIDGSRLSLHMFQDDVPKIMNRITNLHTLMVFADNLIHPYALEKMILSSFQSLRVLDLEGASVESLPNAVGNLINLHFLNLRGTSIKKLPRSIGRLINLQTLDLTDSEVVKLPDEIVKLINLRHLLAFYDHYGGTQVPENIGDWKDLQSLDGVKASDKVIQEVGRLTQLRSFTIVKVRPSDETALGASLSKMNKLVTLVIYSIISGDYVMQLEVLSPPKNLQRLTLRGRLEGLPCSFGSLVNLTHLYLFQSRLLEDPLPSFQSLPNLAHLTLTGAFNGEEMIFKAEGFPSLKTLFLRGLSYLKEIMIEKGAMEKIQVITLHSCKQLKILPLGIEHLKTLKEFELFGMPVELMDIVRAEGEDHAKILHIPCIKLTYLSKGEWIYEDIYNSSHDTI
ncbi:Disease resistance protein RPM1 [Acorus calamus]|uniref:Disease resistance protein RPM1 n=1 Tax=Acorus calamus TaxID=4465 RepID=A0AAV9ED27_ACOCL|nr:Disease resistance protein RPM1 [Acorus calamus]